MPPLKFNLKRSIDPSNAETSSECLGNFWFVSVIASAKYVLFVGLVYLMPRNRTYHHQPLHLKWLSR